MKSQAMQAALKSIDTQRCEEMCAAIGEAREAGEMTAREAFEAYMLAFQRMLGVGFRK